MGAAGGVVTLLEGFCDMKKVHDKPHPFKLEAVPGTTVEALAGEIARYEGDGGTPRTAWPVRADGLIPMQAVRGGRPLILVGVVPRQGYDLRGPSCR